MAALPSLVETIGTSGSDSLRGGSEGFVSRVVYGLGGDDRLSRGATEGLSFDIPLEQFLLGGSGNDTYEVDSGHGAIVIDAFGSTADRLVLAGVDSEARRTIFAQVDGDLLVADLSTDTAVMIVDWLDPIRKIDTIEFADAEVRPGVDFGVEDREDLDTYAGSFTWPKIIELFEDEFGEAPFTAAEVRGRLAQLAARADKLEKGSGGGSDSEPRDITGTPAGEKLVGGAGADRLDGAGGNDRVSGAGGDDIIIGGPGNDKLSGGAGLDRFEFESGFGRDVITDAEDGEEFAFDGADSDDLVFVRKRGDLIVGVDSTTDTVVVKGYYSKGLELDFGGPVPGSAREVAPLITGRDMLPYE